MPKATKWTGSEEQIKDIERRFKEGESVKAISADLSCRTGFVSDALRDRGHRVGRGRERISPNDKARLVAAYQGGSTFRALGERFGMSAGAVSDLLKREGVKTSKWETWTPERDAELLDLLKTVSQSEAARRLGTTHRSINIRARYLGVPRQPTRSGENHGSWKGGRNLVGGGYVEVLATDEDLRYCTPHSSGYVLEHRLVMGRLLGRPLTSTETVHHKNGRRSDNRPENLQLRQGQHGSGVVMKCNTCGSHDLVAEALV